MAERQLGSPHSRLPLPFIIRPGPRSTDCLAAPRTARTERGGGGGRAEAEGEAEQRQARASKYNSAEEEIGDVEAGATAVGA